jgi:phage terminase Nu1 subunit (DNA packaging protein)
MTELLKVKADKTAKIKKPATENPITKKESFDLAKAQAEANYLKQKTASQIVFETIEKIARGSL